MYYLLELKQKYFQLRVFRVGLDVLSGVFRGNYSLALNILRLLMGLSYWQNPSFSLRLLEELPLFSLILNIF